VIKCSHSYIRKRELITKKNQLIFQKQAQIAKAIAHPLRLAIIDFLKKRPQCVCDIASHIDSERTNVSKHLAILYNAGILDQKKQGLKVIYSLKTPCIAKFFSCLTGVLKENNKQENKILRSL